MLNRESPLSSSGSAPRGAAGAEGESRSSFSLRAGRPRALPGQWGSGLRRVVPLLALLLGLGAAAPARATTTISSDTTIDSPANSINDDVLVANSAVLTIKSGGSVTGNVTVGNDDIYAGIVGRGALNVSGGSVTGSVLSGNVIVNLGTVNISDGSVAGTVYVRLGWATISGGSVGSVDIGGSGGVQITGGSVTGNVQVDGGTATISGGSVGSFTLSGGTATAEISGGSIGSVALSYGSTATISGGSVGSITVRVYSGGLDADPGSTAVISGCWLVLANGYLTGFLLDGTPINASVSGPVILNMQQPTVTSSPSDVTICPGYYADFQAGGTAATGSVYPQWQVSTDGGKTFSNLTLPSATNWLLEYPVRTTADNGKQFRALIISSCASVATDAAVLTVNSGSVLGVTTQPTDQTACAGRPVTFTAAATGTPVPTVQWQVKDTNTQNSQWVPISGATSPTLTFTPTYLDSGKQYRALFSSSTCATEAISTAATLTVGAAPDAFVPYPNQTVCAGETVHFLVYASGSGHTVQWQVSTDGGSSFRDLAGATDELLSFIPTPADSGNQYRAVVTTPACGSVTSTAGTLTVKTGPAVTTQPSDQTVCAGQPVTFTAAGSASGVGWQVSADGGKTFSVVPNAQSPTLSFTAAAADNGKQYQAVFTNDCGSVTTSVATLTINPAIPPVISTQPSSQAVCAGQPASFTAAASGTPAPTVQWQVSADGGSSFSDLAGATSPTLTFTPAAGDNGKQYRAVFSSGCGSAASTAASLTVNSAPVVTSHPSAQTVCAGSSASFTAAASGTPAPSVQWQASADGGSTFSNISGATGTTLTFTPAAADSGKQYRAVFSSPCGAVTTDAAGLTVNAAPGITTQPTGQTVCAGSSATFTSAASGTPAPTVQWQVSADGGSTFSNLSGATSPTLTLSPAAGDNGQQYRAVFSSGCSSATTSAASLTVNTAPRFTPTPGNLTVSSDPGQCSALISFAASAAGTPAPTVVYQVGSTTITSPYRFPLGTTTVVTTATNGCGTASSTFTVMVNDTGKPAFSNCPTTGLAATATCTASGIGALVSFTMPAASDNCGTPTVSCDHKSGTFFPLGSTTVTATATDAAGNPATCSFPVSVTYAWSGVLQPINADGSSVFKLGNTVPVKFALTGASACITNAAATLSYTKVGSVSGAVNEAVSTSAATSGSQFRYDPTSSQYVFNWGTTGLTAGTYELRIDLGDGVPHTVRLGLK